MLIQIFGDYKRPQNSRSCIFVANSGGNTLIFKPWQQDFYGYSIQPVVFRSSQFTGPSPSNYSIDAWIEHQCIQLFCILLRHGQSCSERQVSAQKDRSEMEKLHSGRWRHSLIIFPLIWQKIRVVLHVWTRCLDQTCRYREYKTDKIFSPSPIELSLKLFNWGQILKKTTNTVKWLVAG